MIESSGLYAFLQFRDLARLREGHPRGSANSGIAGGCHALEARVRRRRGVDPAVGPACDTGCSSRLWRCRSDRKQR